MISSFERIKSQVNSAVMMARRIHLFPFRTQKLSFVTPRVVRGTPLARVGSRRAIRRISSAGRASALQAGGHRFEPCYEDVMEQAFEVGRQAVVVNDPIAELDRKSVV